MQKLKEGINFTMEDGKLIFTKEFLLKRGWCCNHGCRNCPYKEEEEE